MPAEGAVTLSSSCCGGGSSCGCGSTNEVVDEIAAAHESVQEYYGQELSGSADLKTDACCCHSGSVPAHVRAILKQIEPEVANRFYGCGSPIPDAIEGCTVLDLGCGSGRDSFVCAKLAGERGRVIGIDMTPEQLEVARRNAAAQMKRFGLPDSNVTFVEGYLENLSGVGLADDSVDVAISNCVINLAPDKRRVFEEVLRVLKPGGEMLFSDVFSDRRLPAAWSRDRELLGECLAGAMYVQDFRRLLCEVGIPDYRVVTSRPLTIGHEALQHKVGATRFFSVTVRLFKLPDLEDRCEDYGQVATYLGTLAQCPHEFVLDGGHVFEAHRPVRVCGNTASMLRDTRFGPYFRVEGDRSRHFGVLGAGELTMDVGGGSGRSGCC